MNAPSTPNQIQAVIDQTGQPLAYIEGFAYFYGRQFQLSPATLIPRPETQDMIDITKSLMGYLAERRVLDVGTGSGCIAITLALELGKNVNITATDISQPALTIARANAKHHKVNITFLHSDLFQNLKKQQFDLIVANLPYVDPNWPWLDQKSLAYEPAIALYAQDKGLALIKKFLRKAPQHLKPNGTILLEHDPSQFAELSKYAQQHHFAPTSHTPYITQLTLV